MPISSILSTIARVAVLMLVGLLAGSMFGIWRGYDFAQYSPAALVEVWQGSVRGLNTLLPVQGLLAIVILVALAVTARRTPRALTGFVAAALLLAAAGLITRLANQPINDLVMAWTPENMPADWEAIRDAWRNWHLARLALTLVAQLVLILTILGERRA